ncbi:MAG: pilus assembly protein [Catenulispora sp.]|nr:pilus assembly protein [Catenulispora sp.]
MIRRPAPSTRWSVLLTRWRAAARRDEGSGPLSTAIVFPVMLTLVFIGVQLAIDYWVHAVALTAARNGAHAGAAYGKTPADGVTQTQAELAKMAGNSITNLAVTQDGSTATEVHITVTGNAVALWPFGDGPVFHVTVIVPVERFVAGGAG